MTLIKVSYHQFFLFKMFFGLQSCLCCSTISDHWDGKPEWRQCIQLSNYGCNSHVLIMNCLSKEGHSLVCTATSRVCRWIHIMQNQSSQTLVIHYYQHLLRWALQADKVSHTMVNTSKTPELEDLSVSLILGSAAEKLQHIRQGWCDGVASPLRGFQRKIHQQC